MNRLIVTLLFLLLPSSVFAQTHYCDTTPPTSGSAPQGATLTIQHCLDAASTAVNPTFKLYVDGVGVTLAMTKGTTSPVSNKTVYTGTTVASSTQGAHSLQTSALNGSTEGPKSNTFTLTITPLVPSAPTNLTAQ
jgi:hypothetical protein